MRLLLRLVVVLTVLAVIPVLAGPSTARAAEPGGVDSWLPGDVHVHAAGDSGLGSHIRCQGRGLDEAGCARYLVEQTLDRAKLDDTKWMIYTEHVPWLGIQPHDVEFCQSIGIDPLRKTFCKSVPIPRYDDQQARREYNEIRDAVRATEGGDVHALMGQEMGTAGQVTTAVNELRRNASPLFDKLNRDVGPITCPGYKSGHFALYRAPEMVPDSLWACSEETYMSAAADDGAWGGVNHPDNKDGGSRWYCWNSGDDRTWDESAPSPTDEVSPVSRSAPPRCRQGAVDREPVARSIELVNDLNMPSLRALREVDSLLQQGVRVALVGGGDSHTSRPDSHELVSTKIGPFAVPLPNVGIGRQQPGNDGKLGLAGRTWLPFDTAAAADVTDPTDPADPVRRMIQEGRTVATTGPLGLPSIGTQYPGDTARFTGRTVNVRMEFRGARVVTDDGVVPSWDDTYGHAEMVGRTRQSGPPKLVVAVIGESNSCQRTGNAVRSECADQVIRVSHQVTPEEAAAGIVTFPVDIPADLSTGYLRTETYFGDLDRTPNDRFAFGQAWQDGAFSSPIWLLRDPFAVPLTALDEPCPHADYPPPAWVGPRNCVALTEADLDGNGRPDRLLTWRSSADPRPVQGVADSADGAIAYLDDGTYHFLEEPPNTWKSAAVVFYPHAIVDLRGDRRQEVLFTTAVGANTYHYGVLALTGDRRLHAVRSGQDVYDLSSGGGAGYGSGYGCVVSAGGRLVVDAGWVTDWQADSSGASASWRVRYLRPGDGVLEPVASRGGYSRDGGAESAAAAAAAAAAAGANSCAGPAPDIGPIPQQAKTVADALRGLLDAATRKDENAGRFYVSGAGFPPGAPRDAWDTIRALRRLPSPLAEPHCTAITASEAPVEPPYVPTGRATCTVRDNGASVDSLLSRDGDGRWAVDALIGEVS